jgi:hypothetical protein
MWRAPPGLGGGCGDWSPLRQWLDLGIKPSDITKTMERMAATMEGHTAPGSLKFFDNAIRQGRKTVAA